MMSVSSVAAGSAVLSAVAVFVDSISRSYTSVDVSDVGLSANAVYGVTNAAASSSEVSLSFMVDIPPELMIVAAVCFAATWSIYWIYRFVSNKRVIMILYTEAVFLSIIKAE